MSLVLTLRLGEEVYFGDHPIQLIHLTSGESAVVEDLVSEAIHVLTVERSTEVLPNVFMSLGDRSHREAGRLVIDAPASVKVLHGNKYHALQEQGLSASPVTAPAAAQASKISPEAALKARQLNISELELMDMFRHSAPVTDSHFNRRFEDLLMKVDQQAGVILAVKKLSAAEQAYLSGRPYYNRPQR